MTQSEIHISSYSLSYISHNIPIYDWQSLSKKKVNKNSFVGNKKLNTHNLSNKNPSVFPVFMNLGGTVLDTKTSTSQWTTGETVTSGVRRTRVSQYHKIQSPFSLLFFFKKINPFSHFCVLLLFFFVFISFPFHIRRKKKLCISL